MSFIETRGNDGIKPKEVEFSYAILNPMASYGGLYVPKELPQLGLDFIKEHINKNYKELAFDILKAFKDKLLKAIPVKINGEIEYINAYVVGIKDFKDLDKFTAVLKSGKKFFEMRTSLNDLNNFLKT